MRKFLSLMMAAFFSLGVFADGTQTTVYYTASADVIGNYSLKLNVHMGCNDGDDWKQFDMTKIDATYGDDPIYKAEFTDYWNGVCVMQFQRFDGGDWKGQDVAIDGWRAVSGYNGKMYVSSLGEWVPVDSQPGGELPAPEVVLKGTIDGWGDGFAFTAADDKKTASLTKELEADEYAIKLIVGGSWVGEGGQITRDNCTDISFAANTGDVTFLADAAGEYTFVYTYETKKLSVTYPEKSDTPQETINFYLVGSFNGWKLETVEPMKGDSIVREFEAGSVEFKVLPHKTTWDGALGAAAVNADCSSEGVGSSDDGNVKVTLKEKGNVKIKVVDSKLCVTGAFETEEQGGGDDPEPAAKESLKLVPGVWNAADAKFAAFVWGKNTDGGWSEFFAPIAEGNDTLKADILAAADSMVLVRFNPEVAAPTWDNEAQNVWNKIDKIKIDHESLVFTVTDWAAGQWTAYEEPVETFILIGSDEAIGAWEGANAVEFDGKVTVSLKAGECEFKVLHSDWDWEKALGFAQVDAECSSQGISEGDNGNVKVTLKEAGDVTVEVKDGKLCVTGNFEVPVNNDGIYLSGSFCNWEPKAENKFARNEAAQVEEYVLQTTLEENAQIKVLEIANDNWAWYPDDPNVSYIVDAAHAGKVTIYFQKNYNQDWQAFGGYIYVEVDGGSTVIGNTLNDVKATKFIENGQLFIIVNGNVYTTAGMRR